MRKTSLAIVLGATVLWASGCSTTRHLSASEFRPPEGPYRMVIMPPHVAVSVLTAGGGLELREDWTHTAREHLIEALRAQQYLRGGEIVVASSPADAGATPAIVADLDRLHEAVGRSIRLHKYTPGQELPTKKQTFDWTLGQPAIVYGTRSGFDYALFLHAEDSFSSGGRVALQTVSMLGCLVAVCILPAGGQQLAFASLIDLRSGQVIWYNHLAKATGDIRTRSGADDMIERLLEDMRPDSVSDGG